MFTISTCPRCQKQVSIPAGIDSAALVRCPLCDAEYPLSEAIPPELIPVLAATGENLFTTIEPGEIRIEKEEEDNEAAAVARRAPIAAVRVRRRAPKSALQTIIEIVTGGVAGCLVAYYGLAIYFGPQFKTVGLPNLPLPFIAWLTAAPDTVDAAEVKPAKPKPANGKASPKAADVPREPPQASSKPPSPPEQQASPQKSSDLPPSKKTP